MRAFAAFLVLATAVLGDPASPPKVVVAGFKSTIDEGVPTVAKRVVGVTSHVFDGEEDWEPWAEIPRLYLHRALAKVTHRGRKLDLVDPRQLEELLKPVERAPEKAGIAAARAHRTSRLASAQERKSVAKRLDTAWIVDGTLRTSLKVEAEHIAQKKGDVGFRKEVILCRVELQLYEAREERLVEFTRTFEGTAAFRTVTQQYGGPVQESDRDDEAPLKAMDGALRQAVQSDEVKRLLFGE